MSNKMLIDASQPEETRVSVVRGNRIEEFDFESQEKKQLRGNIYLAKVTRVEPSLQAAFIDYGGNRHGFLAFSEIHPDYYQIPVADRQALLDAEAEEARAAREADEAEMETGSDDEDDEAPKRKSRRNRNRRSRSKKDAANAENGDENTEEGGAQEIAADGEADSGTTTASEENASGSVQPETASEAPAETSNDADVGDNSAETAETVETKEEEAPKKPRRRTTRRKPAAKKKVEEEAEASDANKTADTPANGSDAGDGDDTPPTTMAAMVEMDEISEELPSGDDDEAVDSDDTGTEAEEASAEPVVEEEAKPKRKRVSRPRKRKNAEVEAETASEEASEDGKSAEIAKPTSDAASGDAESQTASEEVSETDEEKPKKKPARRRSSRKIKAEEEAEKAEASTDDETSDEASDSEDGDTDVESVGQEDAMEEVPQPRRSRKQYKIQEVIKRRQVLLVQVVKEERGTKGAALTTYLSLAGRYSVLMPNTARGGGISRKITNAADRKRLKAIATELEVPNGMGVILRTAGASRTDVEIKRDFEYLMRLWEQVRTLTLSSTAPCLVYEEGSLIKRSIRDLYDKDTGEVIVAGEEGFKEAKDFMTMLMPSHAKKVKLHKGNQAIFAKYGVESHLEEMVSPQVTLKSGGYLVINQTEALVAVDVNSGRSTREHSVEDTALQTNLEAAQEVARQLRLRDLAGLIVIDFIDMEERRNNRAVEKKLKECLKNDRARIQVGRISHFGLMEMSRQRMRASVLESTMDVCSQCAGTGYVRSESSIALHVFRSVEEHVSRHNKYDCIVQTTPSIAIYILNHKREALIDLERRYGLKILVEGNADITGQDFKLVKGDPAKGDGSPAPIGFQNDAALEALDPDDASDEEEKGGRRKRGRGRRGNKNADAENAQEDITSTEDSEVEATVTDDDEDQPRKKRRRGKRGGKKARGGAEENAIEEAAEADEPKVSDAPADTVETKEEAAAEGVASDSAEDEKPKRRSTVRRKAPVKPKPEPVEEAPAKATDETETVEKNEPPRPKRRTTRRKPVETVAEEVVEETTSEAAPAAQSLEEPESVSSEETESKPKKSGWWNPGGFF